MNFNNFSFYRANPFHKQGFIPPIAHRNRHQQQFLTEIPQGEMHLDPVGRKHFGGQTFNNKIKEDNILTSPEKYPYENRIALDKSYFRSLNTIDIEGSSPGTMMSMAVKNKIKAHQEFQRRSRMQEQQRQASQGHSQSQAFLSNGFDKSEEERRREIAMRQFRKSKELNELLLRNHDLPSELKQERDRGRNQNSFTMPVQDGQSVLERRSNSNLASYAGPSNSIGHYPHQTSNYSKSRLQNPEQEAVMAGNRYPDQSLSKIESSLQQGNHQLHKSNINSSPTILKPELPKSRLENHIQSRIDGSGIIGSRSDLRRMNPTFLSYGSATFGLAGKQALGY